MVGYIYTISDPTTNAIRYVGQTVNIRNRINKHLSVSKNKSNHCQCWVNKLIINNITPIFEIIDECEVEKLDFYEQFYISLIKSWGFDLTNLTSGGFRNKELSEESKLKISNSLIGKKQSISTIEKRSTASKKTWNSEYLRELKREQSKKLVSEGKIGFKKGCTSFNKGKPFRGDKNKVSNSLKKYYENNKSPNIKRMKLENIITGEVVSIESLSMTAKFLNTSCCRQIIEAATNKRESYKNYKISYENK